ncbi:MAG TPA: helix-turn-helix transcriptional regulator [Pyrinomonadaceae bacterium]|nr:helix-turn-helix transcriptional regulator [Pyrinomonadaceae bacterium]
MGSRRPKTPRLAEKLLEIRQKLGLSQNEMVRRLGLEEEFDQERVSKYERAVLEPPLSVLCAYAEVANVYIDALARPDFNLPSEIPARTRSTGVPRENPEQSKATRRKSRNVL